MYHALKLIVFFIATVSFTGCSSIPEGLIWKNEDADQTKSKREQEKGAEVVPGGLEEEPTSPISPADAKRTALSRPKVVSVKELGAKRTGSKYFEIVKDQADETLVPVIDSSARPVKVITYDNNAIQKEYTLPFDVVWSRIIESLLELPINTVDRSSGIIVTSWVLDTTYAGKGLLSLNIIGAGKAPVRYRYTIRVMDRGELTRIMVVPFAQTIKSNRWSNAKPSIIITELMFKRIDSELSIPLASERN